MEERVEKRKSEAASSGEPAESRPRTEDGQGEKRKGEDPEARVEDMEISINRLEMMVAED